MERIIVFAGLLHDIGKLIMRADGFMKNHSATGVDYLKGINNQVLKEKNILESVKYHHVKYLRNANLEKNHIAYIIYEADNISSGIDRREDLENESEELKNRYGNFDKSLCLQSVFNNIGEKSNYAFLLRDMGNSAPNYPTTDDNIVAPQNQYKSLKLWIDNNIEVINNPNALLQLLEATMLFVPSSTNTKEVADISLYDHSKLTAGIASCMFEYFKDNSINDYREECFGKNYKENRTKNYYRLASFDLSGIQNFIYTIANKNALKSLRGRSFYLEFLMEHIQDELLKNLNLSRANILYSGGGHSYLLLPNTEKVINELDRLQKSVNKYFLDKFSTELYLAYADVECCSDDLMKNSELKFKELSKKLSKSKLQRYSVEELENILSPTKKANGERECIICKNSDNLNEDNICEFCDNLISLGKYLVEDKDFAIEVSTEKEKYSIELPSLSAERKFFKVVQNNKQEVNENKSYYSINNYAVNDYYATKILVGDYCYKDEDNKAYSFEDYANETQGVKRLAVLRADVDNLGSTFTKGFGEYSTISRYATLSRTLNLFFKYYINGLCKGKKLAIVYSGGDDVFAVGAWNEVLCFGKELRDAFYKYSCEKLTLSAGIGFFSENYPISKMAELTGVLEGYAKENNDNQKDSIALFGENRTKKGKNIKSEQFVFTWEEFNQILELQNYIENNCYFDENQKEQNKVFFSTGFIYRIMSLINSSEEISLARFAYTLARLENTTAAFSNLKTKLYELYQDKNERKKLLTALNLIVYKKRKKED